MMSEVSERQNNAVVQELTSYLHGTVTFRTMNSMREGCDMSCEAQD